MAAVKELGVEAHWFRPILQTTGKFTTDLGTKLDGTGVSINLTDPGWCRTSWSATKSIALGDRLGRGPALLLCMVVQGAIIAGMMLAQHPAILLLIVLRSVSMGASYPVINAIVQPKLEREIRATYLSLQSLAGSLAFSATLLLASWAVGDVATLSVEMMSTVLMVYGIGVVVVLLAQLATMGKLRQQ